MKSDDTELSDTEHTVLGWRAIKAFNDTEYSVIEPSEPRDDSKSPVIADSHRSSLSSFREFCDVCMEPPRDDEYGGVYTIMNADKQNGPRDLAGLPLKFYNETKLKNFKLVKVCKFNAIGPNYGLTFRAREDWSEECLLFRGVVCAVGGKEAVFCEIKDDDEVALLPGDDDYVRSEGSCDSKDSSPSICKNDPGDGSPANSGNGSFAGSEVSEGSSK